MEKHGLHDNKGVYKAIGVVRKEKSSGLKIGSYWSEFDGSTKKQVEYNYWILVDDIITSLLEGKLYRAERIIRKLLCRVFSYSNRDEIETYIYDKKRIAIVRTNCYNVDSKKKHLYLEGVLYYGNKIS